MTFITLSDDEEYNNYDQSWFDYIYKFNICILCFNFINEFNNMFSNDNK